VDRTYTFTALKGRPFARGELLVLHVSIGRAYLVTPRQDAQRFAGIVGVSIPLGTVFLALAGGFLVSRLVRIDPALLIIGLMVGAMVIVVALSGRINMWTASNLSLRPQSNTILSVRSVRPIGMRWTEVRGVADGADVNLSVNGPPALTTEAFRAAGFTARKAKRG